MVQLAKKEHLGTFDKLCYELTPLIPGQVVMGKINCCIGFNVVGLSLCLAPFQTNKMLILSRAQVLLGEAELFRGV